MSKANEPAFPVTVTELWSAGTAGNTPDGLTKREYFAVMAMQGMLASLNGFDRSESFCAYVAEGAVAQADALIAELEKSGE
jgi:hypothetical protein